MTGITTGRVSPFGHLGINACVPLPRAYRSLPRPSSPLCAQASSTCFLSLDHIICWCKQRITRDLLRTTSVVTDDQPLQAGDRQNHISSEFTVHRPMQDPCTSSHDHYHFPLSISKANPPKGARPKKNQMMRVGQMCRDGRSTIECFQLRKAYSRLR